MSYFSEHDVMRMKFKMAANMAAKMAADPKCEDALFEGVSNVRVCRLSFSFSSSLSFLPSPGAWCVCDAVAFDVNLSFFSIGRVEFASLLSPFSLHFSGNSCPSGSSNGAVRNIASLWVAGPAFSKCGEVGDPDPHPAGIQVLPFTVIALLLSSAERGEEG